jgi:hypothetical protein
MGLGGFQSLVIFSGLCWSGGKRPALRLSLSRARPSDVTKLGSSGEFDRVSAWRWTSTNGFTSSQKPCG